MKFIVSDDSIDVNGTSLQGHVKATFEQLETLLGEPTVYEPSGEEKSTVEWELKFEDGTVATIYDWKRYTSKVPEGVYAWHVGGNDETAVKQVADLLSSN